MENYVPNHAVGLKLNLLVSQQSYIISSVCRRGQTLSDFSTSYMKSHNAHLVGRQFISFPKMNSIVTNRAYE